MFYVIQEDICTMKIHVYSIRLFFCYFPIFTHIFLRLDFTLFPNTNAYLRKIDNNYSYLDIVCKLMKINTCISFYFPILICITVTYNMQFCKSFRPYYKSENICYAITDTKFKSFETSRI